MNLSHPRIILNPPILAGQPVVRGTRLAVGHLIGLLAEGWSEGSILADCAGCTNEDLAVHLAGIAYYTKHGLRFDFYTRGQVIEAANCR